MERQANYALVPVVCAHQGTWLVPVLSLCLALIAMLGGFLSWRALLRQPLHPDHLAGGSPHRFMAVLGVASAALFAAVILLQGAGGLVLHGCER